MHIGFLLLHVSVRGPTFTPCQAVGSPGLRCSLVFSLNALAEGFLCQSEVKNHQIAVCIFAFLFRTAPGAGP